MTSHEPVLSKGQFYDSDEEERAIEINPLESILHGSFQWSTYSDQDVSGFVINDSIGNAIGHELVKQLDLKKIVSLKHNNVVITDVYAGDKGSAMQNFVLVWNISNNSMSTNRVIPIELVHSYNNILIEQFHFSRIFVIDAFNVCNLAIPLKTYKNDCALRMICAGGSCTTTSTNCFNLAATESQSNSSFVFVPKLQDNVIVTGLTASLINKADAKAIACTVIFVMKNSTMYDIETAKKLEYIWASIHNYINFTVPNAIKALKLPSQDDYSKCKNSDVFLFHTDNLYS